MNTRNYSLANLQDKVHDALFRRKKRLFVCLPYQRRGNASRNDAHRDASSEQTAQGTSGLVTAYTLPGERPDVQFDNNNGGTL